MKIGKIQIGDKEILFGAANDLIVWRAQTLFTKEPITIQWLDTLTEADVLYDVGANAGFYGLYAAIVRGARVYAFEPSAETFTVLARNFMLNQITADRGLAVPLGCLDRPDITALHMADPEAGQSCHSVGADLDHRLTPAHRAFTQGIVAMPIDVIASHLPPPSAIKIDVDGLEASIIEGAERTLQSGDVKSMCIETNFNLVEHLQMIERLQRRGYEYDPSQAEAAARKTGPFKGVAEVIWRRKA